MSRDRSAEIDIGRIVAAAGAKFHLGRAYVKSIGRLALDTIVGEICIVLDNDLNRRVCKSAAAIRLDDSSLAAAFGDHQNMRKRRRSRVSRKREFKRLFDAGLFWNSENKRLGKRQI